ncbi:outer membrane protein assembly factor BamD [uncultured Enterovirga sp.]|uniref:outer membrane protein assembly factor BamD n=1 Tax=uncultured Enterovirga sp. TaxID=2026352 RepID=UPI0035CC9214
MFDITAWKRGATLALRAALIAGAGAGLAGCDTLSSLNPFDTAEKYEMKIVADVPAEKVYDQGLGRMKNSDHEGAAKRFADLSKNYPYSEWARKGLIMEAYANYEGQKWDDAITASKSYISKYPNTKDAAYAQYLYAMSNYNQIPDTSRDQERAEKALVALTELVQRYPQSEYVSDARYRIQVARDQLAGNQMEVGRYYLERRNYTAAINRFRDVVAKYQTTRHIEEALERLTEAYMALGLTGEAQTAAAVLGHNFPDSQWYKDSYALLRSGGLEPREDSGSWISRSFKGLKVAVVGE